MLLTDSDAAVRPLVRRAGLSASVLVLTRVLSPVWLLLIAAILLMAAGRSRLPDLLRQRQVQGWAVVVTFSGVAAAAWVVLAGALEVADAGLEVPYPELIRMSVGRTPQFIEGMVGFFGYLDAPAPSLTHYLWWGLVAFLVLSATVAGGRRALLALGLLVAICFIGPVLLEVQGTGAVGYLFWQGRYTLPLARGIPLLAAWGAAQAWPDAASVRLSRVVWAVVTAGHMAAYVWAGGRYSVGLAGPLDYLRAPSWSPPVPALLLLIVALGSLVAVAVVAETAVVTGSDRPAGDDAGPPMPIVPLQPATSGPS